jgi:predicted nucleotidyltransferase
MIPQPIRTALDRAGIRYALIGAVALAARGYSRATHDTDLLTVDKRALLADTWEGVANVEIRHGDHFDPLKGIVRIRPDSGPVDIVVGKYQFEEAVVGRAEVHDIDGELLPIVQDVDLVVLKLAAAGGKDLHDAEELARRINPDRLRSHLTNLVPTLPEAVAQSVRDFLAHR